MDTHEGLPIAATPVGEQMCHGTILSFQGREVLVTVMGRAVPVTCEVLHTSQNAITYAEGDEVLLWLRPVAPAVNAPVTAIILGRIGASHAPPTPAADDEVPDELVLEAKEQLTLRVGDGSITLRADGKIQIKGKDLVSHAQRLNRIKGGAVSIN